MATTHTYSVPVDISGHIGGEPFAFTAGSVTPKDDAEAAALAYLAENGHLEQPIEEPSTPPKTARKVKE